MNKPISRLLLFALLGAPLAARPQPAILNSIPPGQPVLGVLGCTVDGDTRFFDVKVGEVSESGALEGESCLALMAELAMRDDIEFEPAVAARVGSDVPDAIEECLIFDLAGAGMDVRRESSASLICDLADDHSLRVTAFDGPADGPAPGEYCVDALHGLRGGGRMVQPPVAALLNPGAEPMPTSMVLLVILYNTTGSGAKAPPQAQLACEAGGGGLQVSRYLQNGKFASIFPGQSCAAARDELGSAGLKQIGPMIPVASTEEKLIFPFISRNQPVDQTPFWEQGLQNPANGEIAVHAGGTFDLTWEIDIDGGTSSVSHDSVGGVIRTPIQQLVDDKILSPSGDLLCRAVDRGEERYQLLAAGGQVLLTLWYHHYLFSGDVVIPPAGSREWQTLLDQVAYSIKSDQIFFGRWPEGSAAVTATERIEQANPMRQLVLGSLMAGICGSAGLP